MSVGDRADRDLQRRNLFSKHTFNGRGFRLGFATFVLFTGIVRHYGVMKYFADAEAIYPHGGTREMNNLIIGRAMTARPFSSNPVCQP